MRLGAGCEPSYLKPPRHQSDIVGRLRHGLNNFNHHPYDVLGLIFGEMLTRLHGPVSVDLKGQWPPLVAHYCQVFATSMNYGLVYLNPKQR